MSGQDRLVDLAKETEGSLRGRVKGYLFFLHDGKNGALGKCLPSEQGLGAFMLVCVLQAIMGICEESNANFEDFLKAARERHKEHGGIKRVRFDN